MTDKPEIVTVLEDANLAHKAGDFVNALKFYEYFFDHALDDDPYALYGVRLSYCLQGWADLALEFPGAKISLETKKRSILSQYLETKDPERFHDYFTICHHLGTETDALEQFLTLHHELPNSAVKLVKYVWDDLINAEQWSVCNDLLLEPSQKLDELFSVFDEQARLKEVDAEFDNLKFDKHIVDSLLDSIQNVVLVLRHANRDDDINALQRQFNQAIETRHHSRLNTQAHAKSSYLFAGH